MIMNLTKRPGQIGPSINTRTERHGEESVPGVDIPVSGLMLDKPELNALLQDVDAHDALYTDSRGKQLEPRFLTIDPIALTDKFECRVSILNASLDIKPAASEEPELPLEHRGQGEGPPGEVSEDFLPGPLDGQATKPKGRGRRSRADIDG
jgi:hypothetical protein